MRRTAADRRLRCRRHRCRADCARAPRRRPRLATAPARGAPAARRRRGGRAGRPRRRCLVLRARAGGRRFPGAPGRAHPAHARGVARVRPGRRRRHEVRLPRRGPLGAGAGVPAQSREVPARPVRAGPGRAAAAAPGGVRARRRRAVRRGPGGAGRTRLGAFRPARRGDGPPVRLGRRRTTGGTAGRHRRLRGPRQGLHPVPARRPRAPARDVRRPRPPRGHRAPAAASA